MNNDGLDDVIFEGRSTGEGNMIEVYIDTGKDYDHVFNDRQGIKKIDWKNNKISRLYITDWGCCADYIIFEKIYDVAFDKDNITVFKQVYQGACIDDGTYPDSLFEKPFKFEVLNDDYNIRSSPFVDDTTYYEWNTDQGAELSKGNGNIIAKLPENVQGTAVGWKIDNTGREWWYVEIDAQYALRKNAIYENENKFPTKTIGWISRRFVKKL